MDLHLQLKTVKADLERLVKTTELIEKLALVDKVDRISSLPWEVLNNILGRLPMKDVSKTSILSRMWKNNWRNVSTVVLSDLRDYRVVYHVLLSHRGNIEKFMFSTLGPSVENEDVTSWLNFLRRNCVKELTLQLCGIMISLSGIIGFNKLVSLTLTHFTTDAVALESLIDGCPLLEKLQLLYFSVWECLHINAHMLRSLHINGAFKDVCIKCSPHLTDVHLKYNLSYGSSEKMREQGIANAQSLVKYLGHLSQFKKLTLGSSILKTWFTECIEKGDVIPSNSLSVLELTDVWVEDQCQISAVCALLKKAPNLKEFSINLQPRPIRYTFGMFDPGELDFWFSQLTFVKIEINHDSSIEWKPEYDFGVALIRAILVSSPVLKEMRLRRRNWDCEAGFMRELLSIPRASMDLQFKYNCSDCSHTDRW